MLGSTGWLLGFRVKGSGLESALSRWNMRYIWGSYSNIPKVRFYLLVGDYKGLGFKVLGLGIIAFLTSLTMTKAPVHIRIFDFKYSSSHFSCIMTAVVASID